MFITKRTLSLKIIDFFPRELHLRPKYGARYDSVIVDIVISTVLYFVSEKNELFDVNALETASIYLQRILNE